MQHNFFFCTFLCRCYARLRRETSRNFLVTRFMEKMSYVFPFRFFSLALMIIFTLVAASISHSLTADIKISCQFSHSQRDCFLSLGLAFSLLSTSIWHWNLVERKNRLCCCCCCSFILSKDPSGHAETRGRCLKCKISPQLTWVGWVSYGRT